MQLHEFWSRGEVEESNWEVINDQWRNPPIALYYSYEYIWFLRVAEQSFESEKQALAAMLQHELDGVTRQWGIEVVRVDMCASA